MVLSMREHDAHRIDGRSITWWKLIYIVAIPVDHGNVFNVVLPIHHIRSRILRQVEIGAPLLVCTILEPSDFDNVDTRFLQLLDDALDCARSELGAIDIGTITQRTVEQCNLLFHRMTSSKKLKRLSAVLP